ncbi:MAG: FGGY-family carbohydrate kinase [Lachnospiraceae bacterium]|nr:FGGY-family carbohydrate kinase [Lachnospiraceae bacterium]
MEYILTYDIGTTGVKTCLFQVDEQIKLIAGATSGYHLYMMENGGAEQDETEWWSSMCISTKKVLESTGVSPEKISGISFCSQMQGLVLVDKKGVPVHRPMSYMDQRATCELKEGIAYGPQIAGANIYKLLVSLKITGAVSSSVKDPMWKYKWIEKNEPENFKRAYKWLDVKEYIISRCTGEFVMTEDTAYSTLLYDTNKKEWSNRLCEMFGIQRDHLPRIIDTTDVVGPLLAKPAKELGLVPEIPVFGGGGDATLIGIGTGCVKVGQTHIYSGTSGWVSTIVDHQMVDTSAMIAAIVGAQKGRYNYFAEMETAGKCLEWVKDHLALDEIDVYLEKKDITQDTRMGMEKVCRSLYEYMTEVVKRAKPGSGGVIFTPWLHGNRCPFEDNHAAGMFFNIGLTTGKTELIRAVLEGICYHMRWMLECQDKKIHTSDTIRFCGGGALSDVTSQILADVIGRKIEVVENPQNVGAIGAAATAAVGCHLIESMDCLGKFIPVEKTFYPIAENKEIYDEIYEVFKALYPANKKNFNLINSSKAVS